MRERIDRDEDDRERLTLALGAGERLVVRADAVFLFGAGLEAFPLASALAHGPLGRGFVGIKAGARDNELEIAAPPNAARFIVLAANAQPLLLRRRALLACGSEFVFRQAPRFGREFVVAQGAGVLALFGIGTCREAQAPHDVLLALSHLLALDAPRLSPALRIDGQRYVALETGARAWMGNAADEVVRRDLGEQG